MSFVAPQTNDSPPATPTIVVADVERAASTPTPQTLSRPLKALHLIPSEHDSERERVQDLLALRLPESRVTVEFACLNQGKLSRDRPCHSSPVHDIPMSSSWDLRAVGRVIQLARRRGVDLIHAHTPAAAIVSGLAAPLARCPWIYHIHSSVPSDSEQPLKRNRIHSRIELTAARRATAVIGVSKAMGNHLLEQGVPDHKINRVPYGVTCQLPLSPDRHLGIRSITLGTVALFGPQRGTETLIEAVAQLRQAGHDVRLKAVGGFESPADEETLAKKVQSLGLNGIVQWTGYTHHVAEEMADFDIFVLPDHEREGIPLVVLQAMSLAIPVVATRVGEVPEVIEDQVSGRLATPGDTESLVHEILEWIGTPAIRAQCAQAGLQRQQRQFSDRSMARGVAEVYEQLIQLGHIRRRKRL